MKQLSRLPLQERRETQSVHDKEVSMSKVKRVGALLFAAAVLVATVAPAAVGAAPGPGDRQCRDHNTGNPHCPQN
jgi:hypothetical protein